MSRALQEEYVGTSGLLAGEAASICTESDENMLRHAHHDATDLRLRPIGVQPQIGHPVQDGVQRTRHFHAGQMLPDADMRAECEGKVAVLRFAKNVERIGLDELRR